MCLASRTAALHSLREALPNAVVVPPSLSPPSSSSRTALLAFLLFFLAEVAGASRSDWLKYVSQQA